jgi:hypothetical protein
MMIIKIYKIFAQVKVESLNQQNYYKFAAYATKNLTDGVNVRLAFNLTMATRRRASIRNHLDSSNPANWTSAELKVESEKLGIKITENFAEMRYVHAQTN